MPPLLPLSRPALQIHLLRPEPHQRRYLSLNLRTLPEFLRRPGLAGEADCSLEERDGLKPRDQGPLSPQPEARRRWQDMGCPRQK